MCKSYQQVFHTDVVMILLSLIHVAVTFLNCQNSTSNMRKFLSLFASFLIILLYVGL